MERCLAVTSNHLKRKDGPQKKRAMEETEKVVKSALGGERIGIQYLCFTWQAVCLLCRFSLFACFIGYPVAVTATSYGRLYNTRRN